MSFWHIRLLTCVAVPALLAVPGLPLASGRTPPDTCSDPGMASPLASRMPVVFVGHGSPMAALELTETTKVWAKLGRRLPTPKAILCISAHWETQGTCVTSNPMPKTIHDFYGFPKELYQLQYPAPGDPALAARVAALTGGKPDASWGLDHGAWTVLLHAFPDAAVPVLQLSVDQSKSPQEHLELGRRLAALRDEGVLVLASGNTVHNLRHADFSMRQGHPWAERARVLIRDAVAQRDFDTLTGYSKLGPDLDLAINRGDHYLPLLYAVGASDESDTLDIINDRSEMGGLAMTTFIWNPKA